MKRIWGRKEVGTQLLLFFWVTMGKSKTKTPLLATTAGPKVKHLEQENG